MAEKNQNIDQLLAQYNDQNQDSNDGEGMYTAYKKCVDETECGCCTKLCCINACCC
jgi:hypothetical protein